MLKKTLLTLASLFLLNGCASMKQNNVTAGDVVTDTIAAPFAVLGLAFGVLDDIDRWTQGKDPQSTKAVIESMKNIKRRYKSDYPTLEDQIDLSPTSLKRAWEIFNNYQDYSSRFNSLSNSIPSLLVEQEKYESNKDQYSKKIASLNSEIQSLKSQIQSIPELKKKMLATKYSSYSECQSVYAGDFIVPPSINGTSSYHHFPQYQTVCHEVARTAQEHKEHQKESLLSYDREIKNLKEKIIKKLHDKEKLLDERQKNYEKAKYKLQNTQNEKKKSEEYFKKFELLAQQECQRLTKGKDIKYSYFDHSVKRYRNYILPGNINCLENLFSHQEYQQLSPEKRESLRRGIMYF
ncbi:hypothetical protein L4G92_09230 [Neisseria sp. ZJ106]|uniref:Lipoprotein n=1 Tax=Neisseria lisongii TaxID=2912188 RepID=A0ABY7RI43_9NEIS|nr:hypothetical protein [Neisseria lisongii]MCF7522212.1 hypothetical protein [Neisseria lisongii]WCL70942.1 hypothetical protein PJU73_06145 [Neisseria lisongii]